MLIVKGKARKSTLVNILMDATNSICFQYYDAPVIWNSICVDKTEYSLNNLIECIEEEFAMIGIDEHYDYLIIYTNESEEDLKELIDWMNNYKYAIPCKDVLIMCKG